MTVEPRFVYREPLTEKYPQIARFSEEIIRCIKCGLCRAVCPTLIETVSESQGARGRVSLVEAVLDGRLTLSEIFDDRISGCINCKACIEACPSGVRVDDIILAARAELVARGRFPLLKRLVLRGLLKRGRLLPPVGKLASLFQRALFKISPKGSAFRFLLPVVRISKERQLPVFASRSFREQVPQRVGPKEARAPLKVAYFVGCGSNLVYTSIAFSTVDVLAGLGVEVLIPPEQGCCGTPIFNAGDFITAKNMASKNMDALNWTSVDAVIISCASCGLALRREYSRILGLDTSGFSDKVMDISEFIVKKVGLDVLRSLIDASARGVIPPGRSWAKNGVRVGEEEVVVTYHDPCHLRRGQGIKDEPRQIISCIPGLKFREMSEPERCCGGGGLYSFTHYEMSKAIVAHKIEAIRETGAEIVLTSCPSCIIQLKDALTQAGMQVKVTHVIELLAETLRRRNNGAASESEIGILEVGSFR